MDHEKRINECAKIHDAIVVANMSLYKVGMAGIGLDSRIYDEMVIMREHLTTWQERIVALWRESEGAIRNEMLVRRNEEESK